MIVNNSLKSPYFSQRNNAIAPTAACNVTAMIDAICAAGWQLPNTGAEQPEDVLIRFIRTDPECLALWATIDPVKQFPPNQWHAILALGTNRWMGETIVKFVLDATAEAILVHICGGGTCVQSGLFPRTSGHMVAVVGAEYDDDGIAAFIIDDPWGDYTAGYSIHKGNDIRMPLSDWIHIMRMEGLRGKFCHFVRKA